MAILGHRAAGKNARRAPPFPAVLCVLCALPGSGQAPAGLPRQGATAPLAGVRLPWPGYGSGRGPRPWPAAAGHGTARGRARVARGRAANHDDVRFCRLPFPRSPSGFALRATP